MRKNILTLLMAFMMALGCAAVASAAPASGNAIGYVNTQKVFQSYPDMQMTMSALDMEQQKLEAQFQKESAGLDDNGKQELYNKLVQQMAQREQELMDPIRKNIRKAIEKAAAAKGINSVVDADAMLAGGVDLTDDVIAEVSKGK